MAWRADFIICPDSMLTKPWVYERLEKLRFKFIGVDEASRFKEPTTERGLAFYGGQTKKRSYHGLYQRARHVVFADGSPMPNRPMELWAPTYALHPEAIDCMDQRDFGFRYCGARQNDYGQWEFNHSSNESELRARLQKDFMHVVTEEELSHPERQRSLLFMNQDVRSPEHKSWERRHLQTMTFDEISEDMSQGRMAHFRRELGVRKIPWAYQYIRERLAGKKESLLIFAWHREVAIELHRKLTLAGHKIGLVIGGTKASEREELFVGFQEGRIDGIIGNIQAMGRGHNLQRAKRVIFVEYSWTDELNKQCEKRASRRGNEEAFVRCEYLVSPNSMDEPLLNSIFTKQTRTRKVIG
jgi:SNF2 family DNA or RNA helicase